MTQVTIHDSFETMKTLLRSDDLTAKETFLKEVVNNLRLDLINLFLEHNLIDKLLDHVMIEAIKIPSIPLITTLYSKTGHKDLYVIMSSLFRKPEAILFFGVHGSTSEQNLALVFLSKYGRLEDVKTLLNLGVPLHPQAFVAACEGGHLDIIQFLKDKSDVDLTDGLCSAVRHFQDDVIRYLFNLDKPINYMKVANTAAYINDPDLLQRMLTLAKDKQPNVILYELSKALLMACSKGFHKVAEILLEIKVPLDPEVYFQMGTYNDGTKKILADKIIQGAILKGDLDMVEYLKGYLNYVNLDAALERAVLIAKRLDMVKVLTSGRSFNLDQAIVRAISIDHLDILVHLTTIGPFDIEFAIQFATLKGSNKDILEHLLFTRSGVTFTRNDTQDLDCCVCLTQSEVKIQSCNHVVCIKCLREWIACKISQGLQLTCPMCRTLLCP